MKKILFVVGSLRGESFNRQMAVEAEKMLGGEADVRWLDYGAVPMLNQDNEFPTPEAVVRLREAVTESNAVWIFTPEYNGSYPGHLKNLLDWLSRPEKPMDYATPTSIVGKAVAISGAGGKAATAGCRAKLTEMLTFIRANVLPEQTGVALPPESWSTNRLILSDADRQSLQAQADALIGQ
ncbi:MAG: NAD(P)H-dependent oxidoreductase [Bacteroidales bacterium]|nr:NAD(P)H-dependent oxidoreductase [Bacteroidales bacterium]